MIASRSNFPLEVVDEGLSSEKFKYHIISLYDAKAREWLNQFKEKLLSELRNCIRNNNPSHQKDYSIFSSKIKTWFKNKKLTTEQQADLQFFSNDNNGLIEAIYYLIAWENIKLIYDKNSALACKLALSRIAKVKVLNNNLANGITSCLNKLHEKNINCCYQPNIEQSDIAEILSKSIYKLNSDEQKKYEKEYHYQYIAALKNYKLYYSCNEEMDSNKDFILSPNIDTKLSIEFLVNLFADATPVDKYWAHQIIYFHQKPINRPSYKVFDLKVIFEIDLHMTLLKTINKEIYKQAVIAITNLYLNKIDYANDNFELMKMRK